MIRLRFVDLIALVLLALLLVFLGFIVAVLPADAQSDPTYTYPMFCAYPGAGDEPFVTECRLTAAVPPANDEQWDGPTQFVCGGATYYAAPARFCQPATYLDPDVNEGDVVRLTGNVIAGEGGSYGPLGEWQAGDIVIWRIDYVSEYRLPFSRATGRAAGR